MSWIDLDGLQALIDALRARDYDVIGPRVRDGAVVFGRVAALDDLPRGWRDRQAPGEYRLHRSDTPALFDFNVGPHAAKNHLHPPEQPLVHIRRSVGSLQFESEPLPEQKLAFLGLRACDVAAVEIQDRVFTGRDFSDPYYAARRAGALLIAVNCTSAQPTCFCDSMGTGPKAREGFDLALTEVLEPAHGFLVEVGSDAGAELLAAIPHRPAGDGETAAASGRIEQAAEQQVRKVDNDGIRELLYNNLDHPRWDDVAERCLACANCTMVCPTCFCNEVEEVSDLNGETAMRVRRWDSCFTGEFSYVHGGQLRPTTRSRYRQWLTHKLATWIDQFGSSGCVGCGRCIAWCPVGIDITEEVAAIRASDGATRSKENTA